MQLTNVYRRIKDSSKRILVFEGGARSSKTYSICQTIIGDYTESYGEILSIFRKTLPALKDTVRKDFFEILENEELYSDKNFNKTENNYNLNDNLVQFRGLDNPLKKRGSKRHRLWLNEANEFTLEDFRQLSMRTTGRIYLDYNPSDQYHWIYDHVLPRDDCEIIHTTYLDNPFLEEVLVKELENLKDTDENYWNIYGLGLRGQAKTLIFSNWKIIKELPDCEFFKYGIDFGFNNPTTLIRVGIKDQDYYFDELLYEARLTNTQFIEKLDGLVTFDDELIADSAEPGRIEEMRLAGYNTVRAYKGKDSVKNGIDALKSKKIYITERSHNLIKEIRNYKFKEDLRTGIVYDEPVKFNDHAMDAVRYATYKQEGEVAKIW